jgi:hypothetical protein
MGASPVYTRRMQRAMGFAGDDVATIFKGMQLDIGAPHEFMDFRYHVDDARHGGFHLASCGALLDVEPLGDELVVAMCHHIEDPTFDATAAATNPRARMRPVHRPPRQPAGRHPHCQWVVEIDPAVEALEEPAAAQRLAASLAAAVDLGTADDAYAGPLDPDLRLERFSRQTLLLLLQEFCLQGHLLSRSFMLAVERRFGHEAAVRLGARQLTGIAGLTARRLARLLGTTGGPDDVARVLDLHPAFQPRAYVAFDVHRAGDAVALSLGPCDARAEADGLTWPALLAAGHRDPIDAIVQAVDPHARVETVGPAAWTVRVDPGSDPLPEPPEVVLASFSTGADFAFREPSPIS